MEVNSTRRWEGASVSGSMKILSFNCRGVGSRIKWSAIRKMVGDDAVDLLLLQEIKVSVVDSKLCSSLWGDSHFEWKVLPAVNMAGGVLCIWKKQAFMLINSFTGPGYLGLIGVWGSQVEPCVVVNFYSPCSLAEKRELWAALVAKRQVLSCQAWCVAGDFNAVRYSSERRGTHSQGDGGGGGREMEGFNEFIDMMEIHDIPLIGRKYTWVRPNGKAMSRLDRFLVSQEWLDRWPGSSQAALKGDVSDHFPLLFGVRDQNWGPKPFRVLNCWLQHPNFREFVLHKWKGFQVQGLHMFMLKEKLKMLKVELKKWNKEVF